jgi:hypothetical protein
MMGLLGEILTRTYHEAQGKPIYVVRQVLDGPAQQDAPPHADPGDTSSSSDCGELSRAVETLSRSVGEAVGVDLEAAGDEV